MAKDLLFVKEKTPQHMVQTDPAPTQQHFKPGGFSFAEYMFHPID